MSRTDCLIVGNNDYDFEKYAHLVESMGTASGAARDLNLTYVEHEGERLRGLDVLNRLHRGGRNSKRPFSNVDFLWPTILHLGTFLHRRGLTFDYVNQPHLEKERFKELLTVKKPRVVAITTTLYVVAHPIIEIVDFVKEHGEDVTVVVGGPFVDNQAKLQDGPALDKILRHIGADAYVISNEGEATLANLLHCLKAGDSLDRVKNLAYRNGKGYVRTEVEVESNPLPDTMVDYSLFPRSDLGEFVSIRTAKSCPFSCAFCGFPQRAGSYQLLDVELVEKELNTLNDLGVTTVTVLDDTFNVPKQRFRDLTQMIARNKYDFKWNSFFRSDHSDDESIDSMAEANCEGVFIGMESASDKMLKLMNKSSRQADYRRAIPRLREAGILTYASLIVGYPGETQATHRETVDFIEDTRPDFFRGQLWYADPITPIWEKREEIGLRGRAYSWSHDTMDAKTACDLIDAMLLNVSNSTWLPQYGFEQWSTYYLQRKGMSRAQMKAFIACFDEAVKDKLRDPDQRLVQPNRLASLDGVCQF